MPNIMENNNQSLFDQVKGEDAAHYLSQQAQRAALTRLPRFESNAKQDIKQLMDDNMILKRNVSQLYRLISIAVVLLLAIVIMGAALCLL